MRLYRQGDVLLRGVEPGLSSAWRPAELPAASTVEEQGEVVLAHGERTGHRHRFAARAPVRAWSEGRRRFVVVGGRGARLVHEEHGPISIPPGAYEVVIQQEFSPYRLAPVED